MWLLTILAQGPSFTLSSSLWDFLPGCYGTPNFLRQSPEGRGLHPIGPLPHQVKGQPWAMEAPTSILKVAGSEGGSYTSPKAGVVGFIMSLFVIFFFSF